ncbi:MAG: helix-turn-helix transcriptional regulator [Desulfobacterales bacterium]|nr:helix-turn-helix transcriptional regulator [Desulfobacterales bacterium]
MSRKTTKSGKRTFQPGSKKAERYIQPSILLALKEGSTYGYELIQEISKFGFVEGQAPPGMIYRHLRDLEENGLVVSEWETQDSGPAKRNYNLTDEGQEVLLFWIDYMQNQAEKLLGFIEIYQRIKTEADLKRQTREPVKNSPLK